MCCEDRELDISRYIDNDLDSEEVAELEAHLQTCAGCSLEYRSLKNNQMMLGGMPRHKAPVELKAAVMRRIQAEARVTEPAPAVPAAANVIPLKTRRPAMRRAVSILLAAACLIVVLFFGIVAVGYLSEGDVVATPEVAATSSIIEGHASFMLDDDPLSDRAAWTYVRSDRVLQNAMQEEAVKSEAGK